MLIMRSCDVYLELPVIKLQSDEATTVCGDYIASSFEVQETIERDVSAPVQASMYTVHRSMSIVTLIE